MEMLETVLRIETTFAIEVLKPEYLGFLLLYIGPDQILPLTSVLGAIIGILLMFWRYIVSLAGRVWQLLFRR
jgi:hypothetical protein